jgi:hypothetical protein
MTDERTDQPIDETPDAALEPEEPTAGDLLAAEDELPEDELAGGELAEDEGAEDELPEDEAVLAEPEPVRGSRAGRAERAARDRAGRGGARPAPGTSVRAGGIPLDPSLRIRDRASQAFVILAVLVYLAIFLNAMAFGHGGAFTTTPQPTVAASSSASPGASGASPAPSPAVSPAAS